MLSHQVTDRRSSALEGIQVLLDGVYVLLTVHIEKSRFFFNEILNSDAGRQPNGAAALPCEGATSVNYRYTGVSVILTSPQLP